MKRDETREKEMMLYLRIMMVKIAQRRRCLLVEPLGDFLAVNDWHAIVVSDCIGRGLFVLRELFLVVLDGENSIKAPPCVGEMLASLRDLLCLKLKYALASEHPVVLHFEFALLVSPNHPIVLV